MCSAMLIPMKPLISVLLVLVACNIFAISPKTHARIIKQPVYHITWAESNNQINYRSVCLSYGFGTVKYHGCRAQAKEYIVSQCRNMTANNSTKRQRYKFCHASSQFNPISSCTKDYRRICWLVFDANPKEITCSESIIQCDRANLQ